MKFPFLIMALVLTLSSCKKICKETELRIDLVSNFDNDLVVIKLDDETIYSDYVKTSAILGLGDIIRINKRKGKYKITIAVNGIEVEDKFRHKEGSYVVIRYAAPSTISIDYPDDYCMSD